MNQQILFAVIVLMFLSCGVNRTVDKNEAIEHDSIATQNVAVVNDSISTKNHQESLNEIRFGKWTQADWYDNEYFRFLRETFNDHLEGKIEIAALTPFQPLLHSKFVILQVNPFLMGGLLVDLIFIDFPEKVFTTNIYSNVDEKTEKVVDYSVRGFQLNEDDSGLTKEDILEIIKEHPENKLW